MTLAEFDLLLPKIQVFMAQYWGTYLAFRWQAGELVNLYCFADAQPGFFVELSYLASQQGIGVLRSFVSWEHLSEYPYAVSLPDL